MTNQNVRVTQGSDGRAVFSGGISAEEANRRATTEHLKKNGAGMRVPQLSPGFAAVMEERKLYIYNVGPFKWLRPMGSPGFFTVQACPEGQEFGVPLEIPGFVPDYVRVDSAGAWEMRSDDGDYFADQVMGIGQSMRPEDSLLNFGVFKSKHYPPLQHEIDGAIAKLRRHMQMLVNEMNIAHSRGPGESAAIQRPEHFTAAAYLKLTKKDCAWLEGSEPVGQRETCPACGNVYSVGIFRCGSCEYILDPAKYEAAIMEGRFGVEKMEALQASKKTKGKPVTPPLA